MANLQEVERAVKQRAPLVGAGPDELPTYGHSRDMGYPHVEVDAGGYHFVVMERGRELERHTYDDLDDLLYKIFQTATFSLAVRWELDHRIERQDFRRQLFQRQLELMAQLSPAWAERLRRHIAEVLRDNPYLDEG